MDKRIKQAYESIGFESELSESALENILDEKNRKGANTMKKNLRHRKTVAVIAAAAAALAMSVTAGAVVYNNFFHKESVDNFGIGDAVQSDGVSAAASGENEHIRLTADTVISDGHIANIIFTLEPLDDQGREFMSRNQGIPMMEYSADEAVIREKSSWSENIGNKKVKELGMATWNMDWLREAPKLNSDGAFSFLCSEYFGENNPGTIYLVPEDYKVYAEDPGSPGVFDGIVLKIDVSRNSEVKEFTDGKNKFYLSAMTYSVIWAKGHEAELKDFTDAQLNYADGTSETLRSGGGVHSSAEYDYTFLRRTIDIDKVVSVTYRGIEFR